MQPQDSALLNVGRYSSHEQAVSAAVEEGEPAVLAPFLPNRPVHPLECGVYGGPEQAHEAFLVGQNVGLLHREHDRAVFSAYTAPAPGGVRQPHA